MSEDAPLRHPAFVVYQLARLGSVFAVQMMSVAIAWHVYDRTEDPMALGMVGLAQFVPLFLISPIAGDVVDRLDRKHVLIACHGVVLACGAALAWLATQPGLGVEPIYAVLVVFGAARAFAGPASQALLPALVPPLAAVELLPVALAPEMLHHASAYPAVPARVAAYERIGQRASRA